MALDLQACPDPQLPPRLAREAEKATAEVLEAVLTEIPLYRTLDHAQLADVRETVRAGYLASLELWAGGHAAGPEQLRRFRANGATRAAEGRPLPLVLRAYRVSGLGIYDYVVRHSEAQLDREQERNFARLVMTFIDQLSNEVTIGYVEATGQLARQQGRAKAELLEDLLGGRLLSSAEVVERAATLGLDLPDRPSLLVAAPAVGRGSDLADRARTVLHELTRVRDQSRSAASRLQLITRGQLVVIDEATDFPTVRRALDAAGLTGVVITVDEMTDLATAYQRAREVLLLMQSAHLPAGLSVGDDDVAALGLLARAREDELAGQAVDAILGALVLPQHAELLLTLDAFLTTGNAVSAAHHLAVHPQTLRYRLRRIRELTRRDPAQGWDRFLLELALRLSDKPPGLR